jgi:hypothetical protein
MPVRRLRGDRPRMTRGHRGCVALAARQRIAARATAQPPGSAHGRKRSECYRALRPFGSAGSRGTLSDMARANEAHRQRNATVAATPAGINADAHNDPFDPRAFGLVKAAYSVREALDVLSIGRTSLYAAVKRGELKPTKYCRKTLFLAADLAAFLAKLSQSNGSR